MKEIEMETVRVNSLPGLVSAVPSLMGYVPSDAVVALCFAKGRLVVGMAVRESAAELADSSDELRGVLSFRVIDDEADAVVLLAMDAADGVERIEALESVCREAGLSVIGRAVVAGGAVTNLATAVTESVPEMQSHLAAAMVASGAAPMSSREAVGETFEPVETEGVSVALAQDGHMLAAAVLAWRPILDLQGPAVESLPAEVVAKAASALLEVGVRDALLARICPGVPDLASEALGLVARELVEDLPEAPTGPGAGMLLAERLRVMATRMKDEDATPTLTAAATLYWWAGDGTRAAFALERALRAHPTYRLARLTYAMVTNGIRLSGGDPVPV